MAIYCGDCREILPRLCPGAPGLFVLTDPPYGIGLQTAYKSRKRGRLAECHDFPPVYGDDEPYDPAPILALGARTVLFGANYYAERLPPSPSWIVWDKLDGLMSAQRSVGFCDQADCELAWTNLGGPCRILRHRWIGMLKASEAAEERVHPTQKPVALMAAILLEWSRPSDTIIDPYFGSGATLVAAARLGRRAIGIEMSADYCAEAIRRVSAETPVLFPIQHVPVAPSGPEQQFLFE